MNLLKLTATASLFVIALAGLSSCEKESEKQKVNLYMKDDIVLTGAQIKPTPSPSAGLGKISVSYDKRNKVLNYLITWSGLSDSVIAIRINGPAPYGFNSVNPAFTGANPNSFTTTPYLVLQQFTGTAPKALYGSNGSYTGTLAVDGVKVKEQDLLNGYYYVTLHTKTMLPVVFPGNFLFRWLGEIRAQITFD